MKKNDIRWSGFLLTVLIISLLMYAGKMTSKEPEITRAKPADGNHFFIQLTGDVNNPGVYSFSEPVDSDELISACGGFKAECRSILFLTDLNLVSGTCINVKRNDDECVFTQNDMSAFYKITLGIPIDINSEPEEGLTAIPGIGNSLAHSIVAQRTKKSGFKNPGEIREVPGIGKSLYEKIIPYITMQ